MFKKNKAFILPLSTLKRKEGKKREKETGKVFNSEVAKGTERKRSAQPRGMEDPVGHPNGWLPSPLTQVFAPLALCPCRPMMSLTLPLGIEKGRKTTGSRTPAKIHLAHHAPSGVDNSDLLLKQPLLLIPNTDQPPHPKGAWA